MLRKIVEDILTKQRIAQEAYKQKKLSEQRRRLQSPQEQVPGYIAQLKDTDASARSEAEVREECAEALGRIASKAKDKSVLGPAVKPLIKALQDERQTTGDYAARALRDIRG